MKHSFCKVLSLITASAAAAVLLTSCSLFKKQYSGIDIYFPDFGSADAAVITTENHTVVIDTGNKGDGKDIYEYCSGNGRTGADWLIITHFDKDHVGGAKGLISKLDRVDNILQPGYEETNNEYRKYTEAAEEKGIKPQIPEDVMTFTLDDAVFTVYPAMETEYSQVNNYSLAVTVEYGKKTILFAGDAEKQRIKELIKQIPEPDRGTDLIKMPHHGRIEKNTDDFVDYFKPVMAVITCSEKEKPDDETIRILSENNTETFLISNGSINFSCDGYSITPVQSLS